MRLPHVPRRHHGIAPSSSRHRGTVAALALLLALAGRRAVESRTASACSCGFAYEDVKEAVRDYQVIFRGRIRAVEGPGGCDDGSALSVAEFRVLEAFKGTSAGDIERVHFEGSRPDGCGDDPFPNSCSSPEFDEGDELILFWNPGHPIRDCAAGLGSLFDDELEQLRALDDESDAT